MSTAEPVDAIADRIARSFHEAYERLAPEHGYRTREASAKPWAQVPPANRALMVAVVDELLQSMVIVSGEELRQVLHGALDTDRLAKDIPYAEALRRLREASSVAWPTHEVTPHEHLEVAGYAGAATDGEQPGDAR